MSRLRHFALSLAVVALDQVTKILAHAYLSDRSPVEIIPGFFNLTYSRNPGGLFGYFRALDEPWRTVLLTLLPLVAIFFVGLFLARGRGLDRFSLAGLGLILGGAVGNLIDRLTRGEVVDFLDVYVSHEGIAGWLVDRFGTAHWPTFNVADSAIVCGAVLLAFHMFRPAPAAEPAEPR